jgi:L-fuculose-phosphate aldolase
VTSLDAAKQALADAAMVLHQEGHGDMTRGHVSIRVPGRPDHFLMKAHSIGFDEVTPDNILTFDIEGVLVAGTARPHSERFIHSEIFRARPDVNAVIHTHPTHTVALSATGQPMRPMSQGGALFAGSLPYYTDTIDLIRNQAQGRSVAACLGPHMAVLMRCHGLAMTGASVEQAVVLCVMLEEAARVQLLASAAGTDGWEFPAEDVAQLKKKLMSAEQFAVNFAYLVRRGRR